MQDGFVTERLCWAPWRAFTEQKSRTVWCPSLAGFCWRIEYIALYREFEMMMEKVRIKSSVLSWRKEWSKEQGWKVTWEEEMRYWKVVMELLELMKHTADRKFGSIADSDPLTEFGYCEVQRQCTLGPITEVAVLNHGLFSLKDRRSKRMC